MLARYVALILLSAPLLQAQSRGELLKRAADYYRSLDSFTVKGQAVARIPNSSWQVSYDYTTEFAQPRFVPLGMRGPAAQPVSTLGNFHQTRIIAGKTDPFPLHGVALIPLGQFSNLTNRLLDARRIGKETVIFQGLPRRCEVIDAVYDVSPSFRPHSATAHRRILIDPKTMWILSETHEAQDVGEWTATVTSITINQPPSASLLAALKAFAGQPKDRADWQGRSAPEFILTDLTGRRVDLAQLRGKPVLLDFWGSYCGPCRGATAIAEQAGTTYRNDGLTVLGITEDVAQDARDWLNFNHFTLAALLDPGGATFDAYKVHGIPDMILIDGQGKVVKYWVGLDDPKDFTTTLDAFMKHLQDAGPDR
jgi:cytochrome c biogenesis protein CcmG, thiol:disulfide interchange protein DsbE